MTSEMPSIYQLAAGAIIGVVCLVTVRRQTGEIALLLGALICVGLLLAAAQGLSDILELVYTLAELAGVDNDLLTPLLKTVGIALVTGLAAQVCRDAGAGSVAMVLELCGGLCALYAALPLVQAVVALVSELL
ncbi:MAG: stage III sporulation AC/AD family protein [Clostridiales bacterium]|nr:stage III sporulation AC/AD family protein [Clostridiales bacterium]